jgi:hypothetical protein
MRKKKNDGSSIRRIWFFSFDILGGGSVCLFLLFCFLFLFFRPFFSPPFFFFFFLVADGAGIEAPPVSELPLVMASSPFGLSSCGAPGVEPSGTPGPEGQGCGVVEGNETPRLPLVVAGVAEFAGGTATICEGLPPVLGEVSPLAAESRLEVSISYAAVATAEPSETGALGKDDDAIESPVKSKCREVGEMARAWMRTNSRDNHTKIFIYIES